MPTLICDSGDNERKTRGFYYNEMYKLYPQDEYYWYGDQNRNFNKVNRCECKERIHAMYLINGEDAVHGATDWT